MRAQSEADFFNFVADKIPEEILQQGIAKFLAFRLQAGSYINDVFRETWDFLEGRFIPQEEVENTDLIGLNEQ